MSEYQHYVFRAVDRRLTAVQQEKVRAYSSRATITATSFENVYNWGDFRGDPKDFLAKFFDLYAYQTNWSSRTFGLRLPPNSLAADQIRPFVHRYPQRGVTLTQVRTGLILMFEANLEEPEDEMVYDRDWLGELAPIREELLKGDLRSLYLAWLAHAEESYGYDDEPYEGNKVDTYEPLVPWGLASLTPAQQNLAEFLYLDQDTLAVAAQNSINTTTTDPMAGLGQWLASLSTKTQTEALLRVVDGQGAAVASELLLRYRATDTFQKAQKQNTAPQGERREVHSLFQQVDERRAARLKREAEEKALRVAARKAKAQRKREAYLRSHLGDEETLWTLVQDSILRRDENGYRTAVKKLVDLRDLYALQNNTTSFATRMSTLVEEHRRKKNFIEKARKAKLVE